MSMSFNAGNQNITGSVTSTATKRTISAICGNNTRNATTTIATVGANKIWRIIHASISVAAQATNLTAQLLFNDVSMIFASAQGVSTAFEGDKGEFFGNYESAIVLTAGQTIKTQVDASGYGAYNIQYVEESV